MNAQGALLGEGQSLSGAATFRLMLARREDEEEDVSRLTPVNGKDKA